MLVISRINARLIFLERANKELFPQAKCLTSQYKLFHFKTEVLNMNESSYQLEPQKQETTVILQQSSQMGWITVISLGGHF